MDLWNGSLPVGVVEKMLVDVMADIMKVSLPEHEEIEYPGPLTPGAPRPVGGHTIKKHAGKSDAELVGRFGWDSRCYTSSGFNHGISYAETLIAKALLSNLDKVYTWYTGDKSAIADLPDDVEDDKDLHIVYENNFDVGRMYKRKKMGEPAVIVKKVVILLRKIDEGTAPINGRSDFILTAYPA
ncbi:RNase A-like domain-containing protein [Pseudescherichia sp.]|uniref:RNase A-like domain-containing protein n=1 Tax=Pseudescherichia sp. TaxID=2055881 RepID=UPI0028A1AE01|nr:RNase A-like domain-containing protein [Pseudescherichia sp.]